MSEVEIPETDLLKNTIKYLHKASESVPQHLPSLKSYYSTKFRILEEKSKIFLPKGKTRCSLCCLNFETAVSVRPVKKTRFARRLLKKKSKNKPLTAFQAKYLKKLPSNELPHNQLVSSCKLCKKDATQDLNKPIEKVVQEVKSAKARRKRRRDKFCGLRQEAVSEVKRKKNDSMVDLTEDTPEIRALVVTKVVSESAKEKFKRRIREEETKTVDLTEVETPKIKTLNNNVSRRKLKRDKKKIDNILKGTTPKTSSNGLADFLQSLV